MENPTDDPTSVNNCNILSCSALPDFLTEMTLIILTLNKLNGIKPGFHIVVSGLLWSLLNLKFGQKLSTTIWKHERSFFKDQ